jgi:hypothetical protein
LNVNLINVAQSKEASNTFFLRFYCKLERCLMSNTHNPLFEQNFERAKRLIRRKYDDIYKKRSELEIVRFSNESNEIKVGKIKSIIEDLERFEVELALLQQESYDEWETTLKLDAIGVITTLPNYKQGIRSSKLASKQFRPTSLLSLKESIRKRSHSYVGLATYKIQENTYDKVQVVIDDQADSLPQRRRALSNSSEILHKSSPDIDTVKYIRQEQQNARLELTKLLAKKCISPVEDVKIKQLQGSIRDYEDQLKKIFRAESSARGTLL